MYVCIDVVGWGSGSERSVSIPTVHWQKPVQSRGKVEEAHTSLRHLDRPHVSYYQTDSIIQKHKYQKNRWVACSWW